MTASAFGLSSPRGDDWRHRAACRTEDPELFFPIGTTGPALDQVEQAKAVCRRCPVVDACLAWALDNHVEGVWGGTTNEERAKMRSPRPRGWAVHNHNRARTHCRAGGHEYTPENTAFNGSGRRECRACRRIQRVKYDARVASERVSA